LVKKFDKFLLENNVR